MGFFDSNRAEYEKKGIDPHRLPSGQYWTERFPVLHIGTVPDYGPDLRSWSLTVDGEVDKPFTIDFAELQSLASDEFTHDIHCVTKWSKFDTLWRGVHLSRLFERAQVRPNAIHLMMYGDHGYTTDLPLSEVFGKPGMVATHFEGESLEPDHGYPARVVIPHLYFWKSTKWIRRFEFLSSPVSGYWENGGYHAIGDPFKEQRYSGF